MRGHLERQIGKQIRKPRTASKQTPQRKIWQGEFRKKFRKNFVKIPQKFPQKKSVKTQLKIMNN